jgi:hypothetical protein
MMARFTLRRPGSMVKSTDTSNITGTMGNVVTKATTSTANVMAGGKITGATAERDTVDTTTWDTGRTVTQT